MTVCLRKAYRAEKYKMGEMKEMRLNHINRKNPANKVQGIIIR